MTSATWGEVIIEPSTDGPHIAIAAPRPITSLPHHRHRLPAWTTLLFALAMWSVPSFSHAATYSASDIITATNAVRQSNHLTSLSTNATLTSAALAKANDMFARQYFNHTSPSGEQPWTWFTQAGYAFTSAGENLAIDFVDGSDVVPAWMKSSSHRQNLLSTKYHDIGVAVVDGTLNGQATTLVVQFFGSRGAAITTPPAAAPTVPAPVKVRAPAIPPTPPPTPAPVSPSVAPVTIPGTEPTPPLNTNWTPIPGLQPTVAGAETRLLGLGTTPTPSYLAATPLTNLVLVTLAAYLVVLSGAGAIFHLTRRGRPAAPLGFVPAT